MVTRTRFHIILISTLPLFLASVLDGHEISASLVKEAALTYRIGGWMDPVGGLDVMRKSFP